MPRCPLIERLEERCLLSASHLKVPHSVKGSRTYSDHTFINANWSLEYTYLGNGGTATASQVKKGGSPGAYRLITDTVADASIFYVFNVNRTAVYIPSKQGAITSINYSEYNKLIAGFGQGQATGPALEQNGKIYLDTAAALTTPNSRWTRSSLSNLTAADFVTVDTGEHPDFSQSAGTINFGFFRGNSADFSYTISAAIDNWFMKVNSLKTTA
jgi:hypothetical protein